MKNIALILILTIFMPSINAQQNNEEQNIIKCINTFFDGLHNGDTITLNKVIHKELKLQTVFVNKEGENKLGSQTKQAFLLAISNKNPDDVWLEKLATLDIKIDGNLAAVWTPYKFYNNNNFSHCGVNSFQLFKNENNWEIIYIVDTRKKECN